MPDNVRIALDAMGGDHGPSVVLPGADISLTRHPDIDFVLFGDQAVMNPLLDKLPRLKARAQIVHTDVAIRMDDKPSQALRHGRWKSSMWLTLDAVKRGGGGRGGLGRQYRRADGHGPLQPAHAGGHRAAGDRRHLADHARGIGGARCRRLDRGRRGASDQSRRHGQRHGPRAVRHRAAERRPAQCRRRGDQGAGSRARGRPHPARGPFPAFRLSRLRRGRRHRQGHGRRGGHRGLCRQYRAQDRRRHRPPVRSISARSDEPHLGGAARLSAGARSVPHVARQDGPAQGQWRRLPRT